MNQYTKENPPKRGNGRKIWKVLVDADMNPTELHYNANNWGRDREGGYGSWGCSVFIKFRQVDVLCGILDNGSVYIQELSAPYRMYLVTRKEVAA